MERSIQREELTRRCKERCTLIVRFVEVLPSALGRNLPFVEHLY
jgi:hypothetical protein